MQMLVMEELLEEGFCSHLSIAVGVQKRTNGVFRVVLFVAYDSGRSFRSTFSFGYFGFFCNSNHMFCCLLIMEPGSTWGRMEKKYDEF
jgi:hypothetical protein